MIVRRLSATQVEQPLLDYLRHRLGTATSYVVPPAPLGEGWETFIYQFRIRPAPGLPPELTVPLVLRVYSSREGVPWLTHEFLAQRSLDELGYPVAKPLFVEGSDQWFGGPFMIMTRVPGRTLLSWMINRPWRIVDGPGKMGKLHARLHALPAAGFPVPPEPFGTRHLRQMDHVVARYALREMKPGLHWLDRHLPAPPQTPSIIHLDFHPFNLLFHRGRCTAVLDWGESDVGDRHADVATSLVLIRSAPVQPAWFQRWTVWPGRLLLYNRYRRAYCCAFPLDDRTLHYYMAWAAFRRLCRYGMWLRSGPWVTGAKSAAVGLASPARVKILRSLFRQYTGLTVSLD